MSISNVQDQSSWKSAELEQVVDGLGQPSFVGHVFTLLNTFAGVDHCSLFSIQHSRATCFGANSADSSAVAERAAQRYVSRHWQHDPTLRDLRTAATRDQCQIHRVLPAQIVNRTYRRECYQDANICDKVAISFDGGGVKILLAAYRDARSGMFSDESVDRIERCKGLLSRLALKHVEMLRPADEPTALTTRNRVEAVLGNLDTRLSERETAVLARLATGMTAEAVGLDLGIKTSSVATYRKRAYARLNICGLPELFALVLNAKQPDAVASAN